MKIGATVSFLFLFFLIFDISTYSQPTLISPANAASSVTLPVTFRWNAVNGASSYNLQISTNNDFGTLISSKTGITDTFYIASNLTNSGTYYWRLTYTVGDSTYDWSAVWSFSTVCFTCSWSAQTSNNYRYLWDIIFVNSNTGWIAGNNGYIYKTTDGGNNWNSIYIGGYSYFDVFFIDSNNGWFVGDSSRILKTTDAGNHWSYFSNSNSIDIKGVIFIDSNTGWIAGVNGIKKTTNGGSTWTSQKTGNFHGIYFNNLNLGWAIGSSGAIIKTTNSGSIWVTQTSNTSQLLNGIFVIDSLTSWVVGNYGTILKTTNGGSSWITQTSGTTLNLNKVFFTDSLCGWIVGDAGIIIKTTNGGNSWMNDTSRTTYSLYGLYFTNKNNGWAVGYNGTIVKYTCTVNLQPPSLISPANKSSNIFNPVTFQWNLSFSATSYNLQISTSNTFGSLIFSQTGISGTSLNNINLAYNKTYYWRVASVNTSGKSDWSSVWSFSTLQTPSAPILYFPSNNETNIEMPVAVSWYPLMDSTVTYNIQISTNDNFSSLVSSKTGIASTVYYDTTLLSVTTYYWRVSASNPAGTSLWSSIWNFSTESIIKSQIINLLSGINIISSNIIPSDTSISLIVSELTADDNLILMRDDFGNVYFPHFNFNSMTNWNPGNAYMLYLIHPDTLTIKGTSVIPQDVPLQLHKGWNYVTYLRTSPLGADTALISIDSVLLIVKNDKNQIYYPFWGINNLEEGTQNQGMMLPGKGYLIYVTKPCTLIYPMN